MIYLDNAATTPCSREVVEAMIPFMEQQFGNPESPHYAGESLREPIFEARRNVAGLFGDTYCHRIILHPAERKPIILPFSGLRSASWPLERRT